MSIVTDKDRALVEDLCEALDIHLEPWQKKMLAIILASHRDPRPPPMMPRIFGYNAHATSAPVKMNDQIEGRCNTPAPPESGAPWTRCVEKGPHQFHFTGAYRWRNEALGVAGPFPCAQRAPNTSNVFCEQSDDGHQIHRNGDMHWT